jgi:hypothetical protein
MLSNVIRSVRYNEEDHRLDIRFVSGRLYSYRGVPPEIARRMRAAASKGAFFNRAIRDRYPFERR